MTHATDSIITASGDKSQYVPPPISGACRPRIPSTRAGAQATRAWFYAQFQNSVRLRDAAVRECEQRRGELAIVDSVIRGEYDDVPTHAVGSSGAWPVLEYAERVRPYWLTDAGTVALHEAGS